MTVRHSLSAMSWLACLGGLVNLKLKRQRVIVRFINLGYLHVFYIFDKKTKKNREKVLYKWVL